MEPEQKSNGALTGSIIIIVILIIGGLYLWKTVLKEKPMPVDSGLSQETDTTGATDVTAEMEANLNSIELESLDSEI